MIATAFQLFGFTCFASLCGHFGTSVLRLNSEAV